jgi:lanthanide-dependent methanol dehydrogenase
MDYEGVEAHYIASAPYVGASVKMYAGPGGNGGEFSAWDPVQKKKAWRLEEKFPAWSGALATAGDIVFYDGVGGWSGAIMAGGLDPRDKTSALGFVGAMKELPDHTAKGGTIYVFSLP